MVAAAKGKQSTKNAAHVAVPNLEREKVLAAVEQMGMHVQPERMRVTLASIDDPKSASDRLPREGDEERLEQLARQMKAVGQLQPVLLEQLVDGRFVRVFGRRRIAAARKLGWTHIEANVVPPLSDDARRTIVAIENVGRQDLTPAEETLAVDELMELQAVRAAVQWCRPLGPGCGSWANKIVTPEAAASIAELRENWAKANRKDMLLDANVRRIASELVAGMLGKPGQWVRDRMYIGRLSDKAKELVREGKLPLAHAREIAKLGDEKRRDELAKAYAAGGSDSISDLEPGKLEDLYTEVRRCVFSLAQVPWRREVAFAEKPACDGCPHNSATHPGLFEVGGDASLEMKGGLGTYASVNAGAARVEAAGICTLPSCYEIKNRAAKAAISTAAKKIVERNAAKDKKAPKPAELKVLDFVNPKALEGKVEERRKLSSGRRKAAPSIKRDPAAERAETARREAGYKLNDALRKRAQAMEKPIVDALSQKPGALAMLAILKHSKAWIVGCGHQDVNKKKAKSPELRAQMALLLHPSLDNLVKLEQAGGFRVGVINAWNEADSGIIDTLCEVIGVKVPEMPTLESFLPKPGKATPIVDDGEGDE